MSHNCQHRQGRKSGGVCRHLPTILISGRDDRQTMEMMRAVNPIASLLKPFDEKTLLRAIRKALSSRLNSPF